ncbi:hypothetical protein A6770_40510 [Nostoc minutum NIES-26]|uniref:Uncharacterized protein n=1 Tax=Nostoc minutum NIES-26 TaxID=1844469 RepID=A0A367RM07_9NOSO|nr:hypothetical protein A6770_40510 [Nostoc minutum NIES-26]
MKIIKKSEQLTLKKMKEIEQAEDQLLQSDRSNLPQPVAEEKPILAPQPEPNYVPLLDNPPVQSVCNSGWQVSEIWRDLRVDEFCD